jgi:hypothetical protein
LGVWGTAVLGLKKPVDLHDGRHTAYGRIQSPVHGRFSRLLWAKRKKRPLVVLFLDLDHFKPFNDIHGHNAGEAVLRSIAGIISAVTT